METDMFFKVISCDIWQEILKAVRREPFTHISFLDSGAESKLGYK